MGWQEDFCMDNPPFPREVMGNSVIIIGEGFTVSDE